MVGGSFEETVGAFVDELDAMDDPRASAEYRIGVARHLGVQTLRQAQELAT